MPDVPAHQAVKDEQRAFYALGDYSWLAQWFMPAAEKLVEVCAVGPGDRVLDVAAGDGNAAVAAARRGAAVTATDLTPEQVEAGRRRCADEGLPVAWRVADAEALPFPDGSFDRVLSTFGVVYAPRPDVAAAELFRVLAPGGVLGLTSWPPGGFTDQVMAAADEHLPEEAGGEDDGPAPELWGEEATARARLSPHAAFVDFALHPLERRADSAASLWEEARRNVPALLGLASMMSPEGFETFGRSYQRIVEAHARHEPDGIVVDVEYALVTARGATSR